MMSEYKKLVALLVFSTLPCAAQTLKFYDDFDHKVIDPSKWAYAICHPADWRWNVFVRSGMGSCI
jgi:hypothetical protein